MKNTYLKLILILIIVYFFYKTKQLINSDELYHSNENFENDSFISNNLSINKIKQNLNIQNKKEHLKMEKTKKEDLKMENTKEHLNKNEILFQDYGTTNYIHPNNMTKSQIEQHKQNYPKNMTLQDYVNWLLLNRDNIDNLEHIHTVNLQDLFKNKRIYQVPIDSKSNENEYICDNQFILKNPRLINIKNDTVSSNNINEKTTINSIILPFNYVNYSDYRHNFDVYGLNGKVNKNLDNKKDLKNFKRFLIP